MMRKDALDKLLEKVDEEYAQKILQLEELAEMAGEVNNAKAVKRRDQLMAFIEQFLQQAVDDDGELINPDLADAVDFFENQSPPEMEDLVDTVKDRINEELQNIRDAYKALKGVRKDTPLEAFFVAEPEDEEKEEEEE